MGLSNFPPPAEGVLLLPVLLMNTVMSMAFLKSLVRSVIQMMSASGSASPSSSEEEYDSENARERRISITQFKSLRQSFNGGTEDGSASRCIAAECCVCLCGFEADEEVSELSCKHFFHKACLSKWFDNKHITCPLCRSIQ
ncbi:probable E3 ubiquitin-protein ligase XERICO [Momordica charantia]|uniref:Probable E3 ubiquitin-protein ligase XERICO n=1 Tax=Momordica charantia TaxID=3673 RepID=A0A6J1DFU2_MOMCH|nr:probable E3 ubiquitin-protein ligase XERICO [Momordica charantia]